MKNKICHNFCLAPLKRKIEEWFYGIVKQYLGSQKRISMVSGPACEEHYKNAMKIFGKDIIIDNYEIKNTIAENIYNKSRKYKNVFVHNKSIENANTRFNDCDLTCQTDLLPTINALKTQIRYNNFGLKAFIFTTSVRSRHGKFSAANYLNSIIDILGAHATKEIGSDIMWPEENYQLKPDNQHKNGQKCLRRKITFEFSNMGRIRHYECIYYNAGGGYMLTCLLIYK